MNDSPETWLQWLQSTSVALRRCDAAGNPDASASGCIIEYAGRRFLLTAAHAVPGSGWMLEIGFDPQVGQTEIWRLRGFSLVGEMRKELGLTSTRMLDCCFEEIGHAVQPFFEHRTPRGVFSERRNRPIFRTDLNTTPSKEHHYGFAGEIKPERHGVNWMATHSTYPGLMYEGTQSETHTFSLPVPHPGHEEFRGCSGAPIVGEDRAIVALVLRGSTEVNTIDGLSLAYLKPAFDLYCASVPSPYGT